MGYISRLPELNADANIGEVVRSLVESEYYCKYEENSFLEDADFLSEIVGSLLIDIRDKLLLLEGISSRMDLGYHAESIQSALERCRTAVGLLEEPHYLEIRHRVRYDDAVKTADLLSQRISVQDLAAQLEQTEGDELAPDWYLVDCCAHEDEPPMMQYLISRKGTIWKCGKDMENFTEIYGMHHFDYPVMLRLDLRPFSAPRYALAIGRPETDEEILLLQGDRLKQETLMPCNTGFEDIALMLRMQAVEDRPDALSAEEMQLFALFDLLKGLDIDTYCAIHESLYENEVFQYDGRGASEGLYAPLDTYALYVQQLVQNVKSQEKA